MTEQEKKQIGEMVDRFNDKIEKLESHVSRIYTSYVITIIIIAYWMWSHQ